MDTSDNTQIVRIWDEINGETVNLVIDALPNTDGMTAEQIALLVNRAVENGSDGWTLTNAAILDGVLAAVFRSERGHLSVMWTEIVGKPTEHTHQNVLSEWMWMHDVVCSEKCTSEPA